MVFVPFLCRILSPPQSLNPRIPGPIIAESCESACARVGRHGNPHPSRLSVTL